MATFQVEMTYVFDGETPEDAVRQMAEYAREYAYRAGYRVTDANTGDSALIDAEDIDFNSLYLDRD